MIFFITSTKDTKKKARTLFFWGGWMEVGGAGRSGRERNGTVQSSREKREWRGQIGTGHCTRRANKSKDEAVGSEREAEQRGPEQKEEKRDFGGEEKGHSERVVCAVKVETRKGQETPERVFAFACKTFIREKIKERPQENPIGYPCLH